MNDRNRLAFCQCLIWSGGPKYLLWRNNTPWKDYRCHYQHYYYHERIAVTITIANITITMKGLPLPSWTSESLPGSSFSSSTSTDLFSPFDLVWKQCKWVSFNSTPSAYCRMKTNLMRKFNIKLDEEVQSISNSLWGNAISNSPPFPLCSHLFSSPPPQPCIWYTNVIDWWWPQQIWNDIKWKTQWSW